MESKENILKGLTSFYVKGLHEPEARMLDHLSNDLTRLGYIQKGEEMMAVLPQGAKVLDWGAGFGQMSYILDQLGAEVVAYDVIKRNYTLLPSISKELVFGEDEVRLPFPDNSFDAVVGCGVLEHVPNILGSLQELYRILKPGGRLFIYNLPYIFSPSEAYAAHRGISVHPIKFTKLGSKQLLELANFEVSRIGHENGIPKRFAGPLKHFRFLGDRFTSFLLGLDSLIVKAPLLRSLISNSIKIESRKPSEGQTISSQQLTHLWWD